MKSKTFKSTLFGILSIQSLFAATTAQAVTFAPAPRDLGNNSTTSPAALNAERIIQKRLVGFDPKQAIETLTYLRNSGVKQFENDGSLLVSSEMLQDIMVTAAADGMEVRILNFQNQQAKIKFAAHDVNNFDRARINEAKDLAQSFRLKCDMDGKSM